MEPPCAGLSQWPKFLEIEFAFKFTSRIFRLRVTARPVPELLTCAREDQLAQVSKSHAWLPYANLSDGSIERIATHFCQFITGDWCRGYVMQKPVLGKPAPRGSHECLRRCNGWTGDACEIRDAQPCTNRFRTNDRGDQSIPASHIDPHTKEDLGWMNHGWTASRCGGVCDDDVAACYCGGDSKYRRIPAPPGSPPGTPPLQLGRPLNDEAKPAQDYLGRNTTWGGIPYKDLYGPNGWCNIDSVNDSNSNALVMAIAEMGFASVTLDEDQERLKARPWTENVVDFPEASKNASEVSLDRRRPLIFVYDLPSQYNTRLLQSSNQGASCVWRTFNLENKSIYAPERVYFIETALHEMMLTSPHRTFDPEEADYFYVPVYLTCYVALSSIVVNKIREELQKCRFFSTSFDEGSGYGASFMCIHVYIIDDQWNIVPYFLKQVGKGGRSPRC
eukprot:gene13136-3459_t